MHFDSPPNAFTMRTSSSPAPDPYNNAACSLHDSSTHETLSAMEAIPLAGTPTWHAREHLGEAAVCAEQTSLQEAIKVLQDLPWFDRCPSPLLDDSAFFI
jgi:hypothetical protein